MSVEVYRQWPGGFSTRRPARPWSYFQQRRPAGDPSTRHDPATAVPEETRWSDFIDGPISLLVIPLMLVVAGLGRTIWHYLLVAGWTVVDQRAVIVVVRDGQVVERHQAAGRLAGVRLARRLRLRHRGLRGDCKRRSPGGPTADRPW